MARALSLAAYRSFMRRAPQESGPERDSPRPDGPLVWVHAGTPGQLDALDSLGRRLKAMHPDLTILTTHPAVLVPDRTDHGLYLPLGPDSPGAAQQFLAHWQPGLGIWAGAKMMPALIRQAAGLAVPVVLVDVGNADLLAHRQGWFQDSARTTLNRFETILTHDTAAARTLERMGVDKQRIRTASRLRASTLPPGCDDNDLSAIAGDLGGRPIWLAARVERDEFDDIITAHRAALRLSHRLLLVVSPERPDDCDGLREAASGNGLRFSDWELGDVIDDATQVVLSRRGDDLGLWYRAAPLTFMAGSLRQNGPGGTDPMDAASLGSAVLYGPNIDRYRDSYSRLATAGAARVVSDAEGLASALVQLIAPDRAAAMALAGWEVATEGAELTDTLIARVRQMLKQYAAGHART